MRRRDFLGILSGAAVATRLAPASAQRRPYRIGWLVFGGDAPNAIDQSLQDALVLRGLVDGRGIEIIRRYANGMGAQLPELAGELAAQKPDLLLGVGGDVI